MSGEKQLRLSKASVGTEEAEAVCQILKEEYFGMGPKVAEFESTIQAYLDTKQQVICVNTGTAALHLAVSALDIKPGDEVLVPSITYVASYQAITAAGAKPISCDVNPETCFLDVDDMVKRITSKTRAIMPVHYASDAPDLARVYEVANENKLRVVEDAAQAFGSRQGNSKVGVTGDIICFSFDGIKNITSGEGGAVVTSDAKVAEYIKNARLLGVINDSEQRILRKRSYTFDVNYQGYRYHMSDIMAAIGCAQLKKIDSFANKRRKLVQLYLDGLAEINNVKPLNLNYADIVPHIFVIRILNGKRDEIKDKLAQAGISTGLHYYPNHLLSYFKSSYSLKNSETVAKQFLTLPLHVDLTVDDVAYVLECLKKLV